MSIQNKFFDVCYHVVPFPTLLYVSLATPTCHYAQLKPERIAARKLIASHSPEDVVSDRHHCMLLTVPENPVAGEELILYFNRNASDSLRSVRTTVAADPDFSFMVMWWNNGHAINIQSHDACIQGPSGHQDDVWVQQLGHGHCVL